jgi:hypothetical protein
MLSRSHSCFDFDRTKKTKSGRAHHFLVAQALGTVSDSSSCNKSCPYTLALLSCFQDSMDVAVRCLEDAASLPPPRKILRRGSTELEDALENGEVELSLPQHELTSWMGRSPGWMHATAITKEESKQGKFQDSTSTEVSTSRSVAGQTTNDDGQEETILQEPQQTKSKSKGIISTKFSDIIGHSHVKLRLEEVLLPLALPPQLADSILTGT